MFSPVGPEEKQSPKTAGPEAATITAPTKAYPMQLSTKLQRAKLFHWVPLAQPEEIEATLQREDWEAEVPRLP